MYWHIDAWDRLGGRAFATQRARGADLTQAVEWGPTVFVGPPDFRPTQVANSALALAATRSGEFEPSIPANANEETELRFPSPDAVAEFVRRAFVGGGRTRGGGGEGGPTDEGEGGPQPLPDGPAGGDGLFESYDAMLSETRLLLGDKPEHAGTYLGSTLRQPAVGSDTAAAGSVVSGALQLVAVLLRTFDLKHGPDAARRWDSAASSLFRAIDELGIRDELDRSTFLATGIHELLEQPLRQLEKMVPIDLEYMMHTTNIASAAIHSLLLLRRWRSPGFGPSLRYWYEAIGGHISWQGSETRNTEDRFEPMFDWPLPKYARPSTGENTVGQLLAALLAAPELVLEKHGVARHIPVFAAAVLASRTEDRSLANWRERAAVNWLACSLPKWLFTEDVEKVIAERVA